jgi:hypothetical protein
LLHQEDALGLEIGEGRNVVVELGGEKRILPAKLTRDICRGAAGIPEGLPGLHGFGSMGWGKVKAV